jgi:hypothetical protein
MASLSETRLNLPPIPDASNSAINRAYDAANARAVDAVKFIAQKKFEQMPALSPVWFPLSDAHIDGAVGVRNAGNLAYAAAQYNTGMSLNEAMNAPTPATHALGAVAPILGPVTTLLDISAAWKERETLKKTDEVGHRVLTARQAANASGMVVYATYVPFRALMVAPAVDSGFAAQMAQTGSAASVAANTLGGVGAGFAAISGGFSAFIQKLRGDEIASIIAALKPLNKFQGPEEDKLKAILATLQAKAHADPTAFARVFGKELMDEINAVKEGDLEQTKAIVTQAQERLEKQETITKWKLRLAVAGAIAGALMFALGLPFGFPAVILLLATIFYVVTNLAAKGVDIWSMGQVPNEPGKYDKHMFAFTTVVMAIAVVGAILLMGTGVPGIVMLATTLFVSLMWIVGQAYYLKLDPSAPKERMNDIIEAIKKRHLQKFATLWEDVKGAQYAGKEYVIETMIPAIKKQLSATEWALLEKLIHPDYLSKISKTK